MQIVPLQPVPSQTLTVTLNGQVVGISVYTLNTAGDILGQSTTTELQGYPAVYVDVTMNGSPVLTCKLAAILQRLFATSGYEGFEGDLVFVDTQNLGLQDSTQPQYTGLGSQYQLVYLAPTDLAAAA